MSVALLKNTAWGILGEFSTRAAKFIQVVLMARILGAEDLGRFNYALALAGLFSVLFDFGVLTVAVREFARNPAGSVLRLYGRVKLISSSIGMLLIGGAIFVTPLASSDRYIALGLGLYLALNDLSSFVAVAYRARGEFWRETALRTLFGATQVMACLLALFLTRRLEWIVAALCISAALGLVPLAYEWTRQPALAAGDRGLHGLYSAFRQCVPLAGTVLVGTVYMNFDIVMLGNNVSMDEVGWYSVAVKTIFALLIMPLNYLQLATLPVFASGLGIDSLAATRQRWLQGFVLSATAGAILNFSTALIAEELLTLTFGSSFSGGAPVLVVFTLIGFLFYLYTPLFQWLLLMGKQKWTFYIQLLAMLANLALVSILVPVTGVWGAVVAACVTHLLIAVGHFAAVWYLDGSSWSASVWRSLIRLTLAVVAGTAIVHLGSDWLAVARFCAVALFLACAHDEIRALGQYALERVRLKRAA